MKIDPYNVVYNSFLFFLATIIYPGKKKKDHYYTWHENNDNYYSISCSMKGKSYSLKTSDIVKFKKKIIEEIDHFIIRIPISH